MDRIVLQTFIRQSFILRLRMDLILAEKEGESVS